MDFVIFSMNNSWIVNTRKKIFESKNNCISIRNINDTSKMPLSVYIVDADTIRNKKLLSELKERDNVLKVYLSSVKIHETALEFPRYDILPNILTVDIINKIAEDMRPLLESGEQEEPVLNKEDAVKATADIVEIIDRPKDEEDEALIDDDFDDMRDVPHRSHRPPITKQSVIYEDEDKFSAFEDRDDLRKIAASNPKFRVTQEEAKAIDREVPEKPIPSLISTRLEESTKVVKASGAFSEETESSMESYEADKRPLHEIIHENNERADANIGQKQFVEALGFEVDMRAPIIKGKPFEFVEFDDGNIAVDKALSEYRISKLQKSGLDAWGIVKEIKQIKQDEVDIRNKSIKERELKRQRFLQQFEDTQVMVPEIKKKEEEKRKDIFKDLGGHTITSTGPRVLKSEEEFIPPEKPVIQQPVKPAAREEEVEFKQREEILKNQEQAKARRLVMETESESVSQLFNRRREEQRRLAEELMEGEDKKKQSLLPDLPSKKLTERSELSKFYEEKNIKRAQSKTNLKSSVRPPQDMIDKVIEDEEGDDDDDDNKKKGFWGKFKK